MTKLAYLHYSLQREKAKMNLPLVFLLSSGILIKFFGKKESIIT